MTHETSQHPGKSHDLPHPIVKKMRWPFPIIWIVPLAAAILTAFFLRHKFEIRGPEIAIEFSDGSNLKPGQTRVEIHGVQVGQVSAVDLTSDRHHAMVHVRLQRAYADIARKDSLFWVVRPEVSIQAISGLGAILSGPYIQVVPGSGDACDEFTGLDSAPVIKGKSVRIILDVDRVQNVQPETPIVYRGVQVGAVESIRLAQTADHAEVVARIQDRYVPLVRTNSQFWTDSGADIHGGVLTGVKVKLESLSAIISGKIEFATPEENPGAPIADDSQFVLHDSADKSWLKWNPQISLSPEPESDVKPKTGDSQQQLPAVKH